MLFRCIRILYTVFVLMMMAGVVCHGQSVDARPIDISNPASAAQYQFLAPLMRDAEVVSLAESIHMTHEFPVVRIGMVRWMNENAGFGMLAFEGSPEDVWVSQDVFLRNPSDIAESTSGIFDIWNTSEIQQLFAYEASTWRTNHPLYITAYDIEPGLGRDTRGAHVFELLAERLKLYASPPAVFEIKKWSQELKPLTDACSEYRASDEAGIAQAIAMLQEWVDRAAPQVEKAFPNLPHAAALRLIPENLRASTALCRGVVGTKYGSDFYKPTRDKNAARFALSLKEQGPGKKLILWAHISHLYYDADGVGNTSVGEILHKALGTRLYTVGAFAGGGGAMMLFSDWDGIIGYGRVWGVSSALRLFFEKSCPKICFVNLKGLAPGSALSSRQKVWYEAERSPMTLSSDFDAIVWVRHVHPPSMPLTMLLSLCTIPYWVHYWVIPLAILLACLSAGALYVRWRKR